MALSKKYYELIAGVLSESDSVAEVAFTLADEFEKDNPRFDPDRFLSAAGIDVEDFYILVVSDSAGIYAPQEFVEQFEGYIGGVDEATKEIVLDGPDNDGYWDAWDEMERNGYVETNEQTWHIFQSGDIYIIRDDAPDQVWDRLSQ